MFSALMILATLYASPDLGAVTVLAGGTTTYVYTEPMVVQVKRPAPRATRLTYIDGPGCGRGDRGECAYQLPVVLDRELTGLRTAMGGCEWVGPRLDGTTVQICGGTVTAVALGSDVRRVVR